METISKNIFIVATNPKWTTTLKNYLNAKLGPQLSISTFNDEESCISRLDQNPDVVIIDHSKPLYNEGNDLESLSRIMDLNPNTAVFMVSETNNFSTKLDATLIGAQEFIVKGNNTWRYVFNHLVYSVKRISKRTKYSMSVYAWLTISLVTFIAAYTSYALYLHY